MALPLKCSDAAHIKRILTDTLGIRSEHSVEHSFDNAVRVIVLYNIPHSTPSAFIEKKSGQENGS